MVTFFPIDNVLLLVGKPARAAYAVLVKCNPRPLIRNDTLATEDDLPGLGGQLAIERTGQFVHWCSTVSLAINRNVVQVNQ